MEKTTRTKKTDEQVIIAINAYLATAKYPSIGEIRKKTGVGYDRLKELAAAGHFKLPPPFTKSMAATKRRVVGRVYDGWYINKPTDFSAPAR